MMSVQGDSFFVLLKKNTEALGVLTRNRLQDSGGENKVRSSEGRPRLRRGEAFRPRLRPALDLALRAGGAGWSLLPVRERSGGRIPHCVDFRGF